MIMRWIDNVKICIFFKPLKCQAQLYLTYLIPAYSYFQNFIIMISENLSFIPVHGFFRTYQPLVIFIKSIIYFVCSYPYNRIIWVHSVHQSIVIKPILTFLTFIYTLVYIWCCIPIVKLNCTIFLLTCIIVFRFSEILLALYNNWAHSHCPPTNFCLLFIN